MAKTKALCGRPTNTSGLWPSYTSPSRTSNTCLHTPATVKGPTMNDLRPLTIGSFYQMTVLALPWVLPMFSPITKCTSFLLVATCTTPPSGFTLTLSLPGRPLGTSLREMRQILPFQEPGKGRAQLEHGEVRTASQVSVCLSGDFTRRSPVSLTPPRPPLQHSDTLEFNTIL